MECTPEEIIENSEQKTPEEIMEVPDKYSYTREDFLTVTPYAEIYRYVAMPFVFQTAVAKMNECAKSVHFVGFRNMLKTYMQEMQSDKRKSMVPNQTEFEDQVLELDCGVWESTDWGIYRETPMGGREFACAHPIMPVERLVNIDTGDVKVKLAYKRPGKNKKWFTSIVGKDVISTSRTITQLASQGISVTSSTSSALVDYLNDMENLNYDAIPESKSIGRLGYIAGEGFSPYVDGLVFDGDASFKHLYEAVSHHGNQIDWYEAACECRRMSVTARIVLAASFASPLLSVVGSLPFFVHLWGVDSGTGKTVALMLAASVWGDPALGSYTQTFNSTQVGQERTAAFLNHLPLCIDELQLTKDGKGKSSFDVYQLAQGVGRARGKRNGGIEMTPTWSCCFLTTGESPLTSSASGAGAVNRVIDIECTAGQQVITDGQKIAGILKQNYGWAGEMFIDHLYGKKATDKTLDLVRDIYQENFKALCQLDSTEKQSMAAAAIITADQLATLWIFEDNNALTVQDVKEFLASREAVSAGHRAYDAICDWVSSNANHFIKSNDDAAPSNVEIYGVIEDDQVFINRGVFNRVMQDAGYSVQATLSYFRANNLIDTRGRKMTRCKRIGGIRTECIVLTMADDDEIDPDDILPF